MRAYERLGQFHDEVAFRAWLYRVAHNVSIDSLRDRGFRHGPIDEKVEGIDRPDVMAERHERMRDVVVAIQELPDRQRDAMVLSAFEGRSYDEISGTLGVTHGATRQLLARARMTLRRAAAAFLPIGLMHRAPQPDAKSLGASRLAELVGSAGAGATTAAAQLGVGVAITAGALGGVAATGGIGARPRTPEPRRLPPRVSAQPPAPPPESRRQRRPSRRPQARTHPSRPCRRKPSRPHSRGSRSLRTRWPPPRRWPQPPPPPSPTRIRSP